MIVAVIIAALLVLPTLSGYRFKKWWVVPLWLIPFPVLYYLVRLADEHGVFALTSDGEPVIQPVVWEAFLALIFWLWPVVSSAVGVVYGKKEANCGW